MARLPVTLTVSRSNGQYSLSFSGNGINPSTLQIDVAPGASDNIEISLAPGTGSPHLAFATPAIIWFDSSNPVVAIETPPPFGVSHSVSHSESIVTIADNNSSPGDHGTFSFRINILADSFLLQSDPTIINKDQ